MSARLADYYHDQYLRFREQYPKSTKRYSSFDVKDLDHPTTSELIIEFLKHKLGTGYADLACAALNMTPSELVDFERSRKDLYNMF